VYVIVDDQLAVVAALGLLKIPEQFNSPAITVSRFQLRLAAGLALPRPTEGVFQRAVRQHAPDPAAAVDRILHPSPSMLLIADPRPIAAQIVKAKSEYRINELAAEVIAASIELDAAVRVSVGNSHGHVQRGCIAAGIDFGIWEPVNSGTGQFEVAEISQAEAEQRRRSR